MEKTLELLETQIRAAGVELRRAKTSVASLKAFGSIDGNIGDDGVSTALLRELRQALENLLACINHLLHRAQELPGNQQELPGHTENVG